MYLMAGLPRLLGHGIRLRGSGTSSCTLWQISSLPHLLRGHRLSHAYFNRRNHPLVSRPGRPSSWSTMDTGQQIRGLEHVFRVLDEMARGKAVVLDSERSGLVSALRHTRELVLSMDKDESEDDEEARRTKQQLSELGMKLMTRIRKVNPKTNDADGHAVKAYIKVIALFLLWHQSSNKSYGGAEERLVAAAKSAIALYDATKDDKEIIACATIACNIWETVVMQESGRRDTSSGRTDVATAAFKAYEIMILVTLDSLNASSTNLAQEIARLVSGLLSLAECNPTFAHRAVLVANEASARLLRCGQHHSMASRCLRGALAVLESMISTSNAPTERFLSIKASILFRLSTCYMVLKEPSKALTCLDEILELGTVAADCLPVPVAKISLQKIRCHLQGSNDGAKEAVSDSVKLLAKLDLKSALAAAQSIVAARNFDADAFGVYDQLAQDCQPTDKESIIRIRLAHMKALVVSLQRSPGENQDGQRKLLQEFTRVATCISQVDGLSDSNKSEALELVKRACWLAFKSGPEAMSWAAKLCSVILMLSDDPTTVEQAICTQAHAMVGTGDITNAVILAKDAYERNPSKRSRLSYLWVVSKSSDEQTVVSALKTLLATESGPQLLESLMTLVHMLLRTPTLDGPHPRRLLAMIFEEWVRVWTEQELDAVLRRFDEQSKAPDGPSFFAVVTDLVQLLLTEYCPKEDADPAADEFPPSALSNPVAQQEIWRIISKYVKTAVERWASTCDKDIVGTLASSKHEVKWLSNLCWDLGCQSIHSPDVDTRKGASDRFVLGYRLASALETQDDAQRVLNDEDEKDKLLFLLVSISSSVQVRLEMDSDEASLPPAELTYWLKELKEAKVRIQPMMRKPLYLALAKNLERTRFILEVLLCFCSASHSFRSVIQSEDALALFHELPVEVLHLFAVHAEREPWNDKETAARLFRMCIKKCREGPSVNADKEPWFYLDLLRCAPDMAGSFAVLTEFRQILDSQPPDAMGAGILGSVADRVAARAYNEGVACLELLQPEAEVFISNALSMLPYTAHLFQDENLKSDMNSAYAVALELKAKYDEGTIELKAPPPHDDCPNESPSPSTTEMTAPAPPQSVTAAANPDPTVDRNADAAESMDTSY